MIRSISTFTVICSLFLGAAQTAAAHDRAYDRRASPPHYHEIIQRGQYMPHWLRQDREFRSWYRRTSLRYNDYLAWWQLYEIFRWERRYDHRRHPVVHYGSRQHDYDWYRRYWHKHDHHRHDRRHHSKRKRRGDHD